MSGVFRDEQELRDFLESRDRVCVLFYASWCPFSRSFLPVFEKQAGKRDGDFAKFLADDDESACDRYAVSVYPSVICFEKGRIVSRLDGISGRGLDEGGLKKWIAACGL